MTMRRIAIIVIVWVAILSTPLATACTFCGGGVSSRQTLREHFQQAKFVAYQFCETESEATEWLGQQK